MFGFLCWVNMLLCIPAAAPDKRNLPGLIVKKDSALKELKGTIFRIKKYALHDGPGIRTTVFLKGCPLCCPWCHNPEGISSDFREDRQEKDSAGMIYRLRNLDEAITITPEALTAELEKELIFFDESGGGVTFSGGEPFFQSGFLLACLNRLKEIEIHTAVDTSGFTSKENMKQAVKLTDMVLFDLKIMDRSRHFKITGVDNVPIHDNFRMLVEDGVNVIPRFPLIPGFTDDEENIDALSRFLRENGLNHLDMLPFHAIAKGKYARLGIMNPMGEKHTLDEDRVKKAEALFKNRGITVKTGG